MAELTTPNKWMCRDLHTNFYIDVSKIGLREEEEDVYVELAKKALEDMKKLERGERVNVDEGRMVGHYWLRAPDLAPTQEITREIVDTQHKIRNFVQDILRGKILSPNGRKFKNMICIGIGGSALGPQFLSQCLRQHGKGLLPFFIDNTDPEGIERVIRSVDLSESLVIVTSKSGGTKETRNGMIEVAYAMKKAGLDFSKCAVAITMPNSALDNLAQKHQWLESFHIWDWVGGRTSITSAVGLLPAELMEIPTDEFLSGASYMDEVTRTLDYTMNPSMLLALAWYKATNGRGERDMVVIPYRDRLELFSRYLQQLVMESLGKEVDLDGNKVEQGISVYGNKGSTDQHAYVQQLRDGVNNFFVVFIRVLSSILERQHPQVEEETTSEDYLDGFYLGTRKALAEKDRLSLTIGIPTITPYTIGMLIALFERAVGFYASIIRVNAYNQPGVEAGKRAASQAIQLKKQILNTLKQEVSDLKLTDLAERLSANPEDIFLILLRLAQEDLVEVGNQDEKYTKWTVRCKL